MPKVIVTKLAPRRFLGVKDAAEALGVGRQTIYDYLYGKKCVIGPERRERLVVRDHSRRFR